jgi:hypothetical protein
MIPNHCIEKFKKTFNQEPSIISIEINDSDKFDLMTKKSMVLWFSSQLSIEDKFVFNEKLVEYDSTGIYIYMNKLGTKTNLVFLVTVDRKNVAEYAIKQLIKEKNNGN